MIIFGILVFIILYAAHVFVLYVILGGLFGETIASWAYWLALGCSMSFMLSGLLAHLSHHILVRIWYYLSSLWLGLLSNLFFIFVLMAMLLGLTSAFGYYFNLMYLVIFAILLGLVGVVFGMYKANRPVVQMADIGVKNLPKSWEKKKVVFFSDVHIGALIGELFIDKIISLLDELKPDIIFIAGDLFDGTHINEHKAISILKSFHAREGIYYVTGNHETNLGTLTIADVLKETNIQILENEMVEIDGVQIIGIDYTGSRYAKQNINQSLKHIKGFQSDKPSILLYHDPIYIKEFQEFGIHLQLSGHTHKGQIWPYGYFTWLLYRGKDNGLYTDGDYNLYTSKGVGTWGPPMRIGSPPEIVVLNMKASA